MVRSVVVRLAGVVALAVLAGAAAACGEPAPLPELPARAERALRQDVDTDQGPCGFVEGSKVKELYRRAGLPGGDRFESHGQTSSSFPVRRGDEVVEVRAASCFWQAGDVVDGTPVRVSIIEGGAAETNGFADSMGGMDPLPLVALSSLPGSGPHWAAVELADGAVLFVFGYVGEPGAWERFAEGVRDAILSRG